jgi:UDP-2,4-diacetamido-2,4,6-trideoxy-beta-L-altropyranose hydrolase
VIRIGYICEAGGDRGWGHFQRGRALLEQAGPGSAIVVGRGHDEIHRWVEAADQKIVVEGWLHADEPLALDRTRFDVLVTDDYYVSPAWIAEASGVCPTFVVDDWIRNTLEASGLINVNLGASRSDYPGVKAQHWLLGAEYALLREEVRLHKRRDPAARHPGEVLLTLGGSDPYGHTAEIVSDLTESRWYGEGGRVTAVLGRSYTGATPWCEWSDDRVAGLSVVQHPTDFVDRCVEADLVIAGASTVSYELAYLGTPFVLVAFVDNQARIGAEWAAHGIGPRVWTGDPAWRSMLMSSVNELIVSAPRRSRRAQVAATVVDDGGAARWLAALHAAVSAS